MLRQLAIDAARVPAIRALAMATPGFRRLAWLFVAGEDLEAAMATARSLRAAGIAVSLNALASHVTDRAEAAAHVARVVETVRRIRAEAPDANLSLKLTAIGLDIDEALCRENLVRVLESAREAAVFVRIDMEEAVYAAATVRLFSEMAARFGHETVGIAIQSYLREPPYDLAALAAGGARIRLVKGGYRERPDLVLRDRAEIDAAFGRDIGLLLRTATEPAIATHDVGAINLALRAARAEGLAPQAFEFQMLYGVRPALGRRLTASGYRVRYYLPFGGTWLNWLLLAMHAAAHRLQAAARTVWGRP